MDDVSFAQQRRRAFEPLPRDWPTTLSAIRAAEGAREGTIEDIIEIERNRLIREAEDRIDQWPPTGGVKRIIPSPNQNAPSFAEPTLIDRLWEDMQAGVGDER